MKKILVLVLGFMPATVLTAPLPQTPRECSVEDLKPWLVWLLEPYEPLFVPGRIPIPLPFSRRQSMSTSSQGLSARAGDSANPLDPAVGNGPLDSSSAGDSGSRTRRPAPDTPAENRPRPSPQGQSGEALDPFESLFR